MEVGVGGGAFEAGGRAGVADGADLLAAGDAGTNGDARGDGGEMIVVRDEAVVMFNPDLTAAVEVEGIGGGVAEFKSLGTLGGELGRCGGGIVGEGTDDSAIGDGTDGGIALPVEIDAAVDAEAIVAWGAGHMIFTLADGGAADGAEEGRDRGKQGGIMGAEGGIGGAGDSGVGLVLAVEEEFVGGGEDELGVIGGDPEGGDGGAVAELADFLETAEAVENLETVTGVVKNVDGVVTNGEGAWLVNGVVGAEGTELGPITIQANHTSGAIIGATEDKDVAAGGGDIDRTLLGRQPKLLLIAIVTNDIFITCF